jgi:hypothetical protein
MKDRDNAPYFYELFVSVSPLLPAEVKDRLFLSSDQCVVGKWFFIRGCIEIPILDADENFTFEVWARISRENYDRTLRLWENPERVYERPYLGWLATRVPGYKETLNLKARVHTRRVGERPLMELEPSKHNLAKEQREGIATERVREIEKMMLEFYKESV